MLSFQRITAGTVHGTEYRMTAYPISTEASNVIRVNTAAFGASPRTNRVDPAWAGTASTTLTMVSTGSWSPGMALYGTGVPSGTRIVSVDSGTQVTLSGSATVSPSTVLDARGSSLGNELLAGPIKVTGFSANGQSFSSTLRLERVIEGPAVVLSGSASFLNGGSANLSARYGHLALSGTVAFTGSLVAGTTQVVVAGTSGLEIGMELSASGSLAAGTTIQEIVTGKLKLSSAPLISGASVPMIATRVASSSPVVVNLSELRLPEAASYLTRRVTDISSGAQFNFIKTSDGLFWAWGLNSDGQLGDGTFNDKSIPTAFSSPVEETFAWIAPGGNYALAKTTGGDLFSWGGNQSGQRGDGTTSTVADPQRHKGITEYFLQAQNIPDSEGQQQVRARVILNDSQKVETLVVVKPSAANYVSPNAPVITKQPASVMVAAGATATLTVEARSELPLQYQWMLNGVDVALGGNSPNYALTDSPRTPIAGLYSVRVSDERGSIVSKTVQVAVVSSPTVFAEPEAQVILPKTATSIQVLMQSQFKTLFNSPHGLVVRGNGDLLVADRDNSVVRVMNDGGFVETLVGIPQQSGWVDSVGNLSRLSRPEGLTVLNIGEFELVFITDPGSHTVRCLTWEFDKSAGDFVYRLRTVAGLPMQAGFVDGDMKEAKFNSPMGVAGFVSQRKDISTQLPLPNQYEVYLYVADLNNHALRLVLLPVTGGCPRLTTARD